MHTTINTSCPVCDPGFECDTLSVRIIGTSRRDVDAYVVGCENGCNLNEDQRHEIEQSMIDGVLAGEIAA